MELKLSRFFIQLDSNESSGGPKGSTDRPRTTHDRGPKCFLVLRNFGSDWTNGPTIDLSPTLNLSLIPHPQTVRRAARRRFLRSRVATTRPAAAAPPPLHAARPPYAPTSTPAVPRPAGCFPCWPAWALGRATLARSRRPSGPRGAAAARQPAATSRLPPSRRRPQSVRLLHFVRGGYGLVQQSHDGVAQTICNRNFFFCLP